jgi:hypothetical protein
MTWTIRGTEGDVCGFVVEEVAVAVKQAEVELS